MQQQQITKMPSRRRRQTELSPLRFAAPSPDLTAADDLLDRINKVLEVA